MDSIEIAVLTDDAMADFLDASQAARGDDAWQRLAGFMRDIADGSRTVWTARRDGQYVGMVSVRWQSDYRGFRTHPVAPEIIDLYVWPATRRHGVATQLMDTAEQAIAARGFRRIGLSVGILPDDAAAWPLYLQRGYAFDGTGAWHQGRNVTDGDTIIMGDDPVLLMMAKIL